MTPFPETEIMTIKRLEVALRKMDFKLLKDGAYKLHEKYHSGHRFEYLDLLKEIFFDISNNASIPEDIKDILSPTIEDILSQEGLKPDTTTSPYDSLNQNRVSSLTSLSYSSQEENQAPLSQEEPKISAFDAFGAQNKAHMQNQNLIHKNYQNTFTQSPFSAKPFEEFNSANAENHNQNTLDSFSTLEVQAENLPLKEEFQAINQENFEEDENVESTVVVEKNKQKPLDKKSVAIFYSQDSSNDKTKNILKLRELISKTKDEHISIAGILKLISEISTQANTNVSELQSVLEQLKTKGNKVNLITNSQSANFFDLFKTADVSFSFAGSNEEKNVNLLPLFGLSNLFVCSECSKEYLEINQGLKPLVLECPKCKSPMFPNFYASGTTKGCELDMNNYNSSLVALANSDVWLLIHPSLDEKVTKDLLKSALMVNNSTEEIYILDKDINVRETYKNMFLEIKPDLKINTQISAMEDFFNVI